MTPSLLHGRTSVADAARAAFTFAAGLATAAFLQAAGVSDTVGIAALTALATIACALSSPRSALLVASAPALFADHFFVAPYETINFTGRDLLVLFGIPAAGFVAAAVAHAVPLAGARWATRRQTRLSAYDAWLLSAGNRDVAKGHADA